jgi:hypothetical protein
VKRTRMTLMVGGAVASAVLALAPASFAVAGVNPASRLSQPASSSTHRETTGGVAHTWSDYKDAGGAGGKLIADHETVAVSCRIIGFKVADGNRWWYRIASKPWSDRFYASADAFYNNGKKRGSLKGTPFVDRGVPICRKPAGATYPEATGPGPVHTWSNPNGPSGAEGPTLSANSVYQIACRTTGTPEGPSSDDWWYLIVNGYYGSADAFCDEGRTICPNGFAGTPLVDLKVPIC